jgi:hypothetical protein
MPPDRQQLDHTATGASRTRLEPRPAPVSAPRPPRPALGRDWACVPFAGSLRGCDPLIASSTLRTAAYGRASRFGGNVSAHPGGVWGNWQPDGFWPR